MYRSLSDTEQLCPTVIQWTWEQLGSLQDGIYVLRKAHMRSIPSVRIFPNVALEKSEIFVLTDDGPVSPFQ